jgi:hypothetical protein
MNETARRAHTRDHYSTATKEPRRAVTSAPRHPLRARLCRLKRRARGAQLQPRLWAFNGPVPYHVSVALARPEPGAQKIKPSRGTVTASGLKTRSARAGATSALDSRELLISSSRAGLTASP